MNPLRVLHCPTSVGGHAGALATAERRLGLESWSVTFRPSPFGFGSDEVLAPEGSALWRAELARWRLLWRAIRDFDVIHFNFGRTILPSLDSRATVRRAIGPFPARLYTALAGLLEYRDLPLLRRFGKTIAVTFQGDDARQGDVCQRRFRVHPGLGVEPGYYTPADDDRKRRIIRSFDHYADLLYALNPDLLHVLPARARFLPYAHIDPKRTPVLGVCPEGSRPPVVMHAPTHRGIKGTRILLEALDRLKQQGCRFELVLVEGLSHSEAMERFRRADLLVDQLLVGFYGGIAVELMAMAKPVVCYLRPEDLGFLPDAMARELPIIRAEPEGLARTLRPWLEGPRERLVERGSAARRFVERWHDPSSVAARLAADYRRVGPPC